MISYQMSGTKENVVLVIGCDSMIGRALSNALHNDGYEVIKTSRRKPIAEGCFFLDLSERASSYSLPENISTAFFCAAETSSERCCANKDETHTVNVLQTRILAKQIIAQGGRVIFLSTNRVYDGSKPYYKAQELPNPSIEYGKQKAQTEESFLALGKNVVIVRLTKVLSDQSPLIAKWIEALKNSIAIHPYRDMIISPLPLAYVVNILSKLIDTEFSGILQVSGAEDINYAQLAENIAAELGVDKNLVQPVDSFASDSPVATSGLNQQPRYATLDTTELFQLFQIKAPSLKDVVQSVLKKKFFIGSER
jgi:dTDP-4-dehydrorhamnose reductase